MLSRRCFSKSILAAPWILRAQQGPLKARVKIDTERTIGEIDPKLYGNFIAYAWRSKPLRWAGVVENLPQQREDSSQ
jgi:hypothetical protein